MTPPFILIPLGALLFILGLLVPVYPRWVRDAGTFMIWLALIDAGARLT